MKCQILYSGKNISSLSSAELAQRVVKVKKLIFDAVFTKSIFHSLLLWNQFQTLSIGTEYVYANKIMKINSVNPCLADPGYTLFCKQCRSRSVGF